MQTTDEHRIKVLVVDDTVTYRMILSQVLQGLPEVALSGTAANGQKALEHLQQEPVDLVLMDIEMPVMNGLEALQIIMRDYPTTRVVLMSGMQKSSADMTIQALQAGALDFIPKPDQGSMSSNMALLNQRLALILKVFANRRVLPNSPAPRIVVPEPEKTMLLPATVIPKPARTTEVIAKPTQSTHYHVLAIGISTGGPNALNEVIPKLPRDLNVPVLLVQHMPPVFTASLAASLDKKSALRVKEAEAGEIVVPNTVYIAPGGYHMLVRRPGLASEARIALTQEPPVNSCRPAVDVLFRTVAEVYGKHTLSVIMTGMGQDGLIGVQQIKQAGGYCLTQEASTCVVYGMPRAVDEMGLSNERVALGDLATRISLLVHKG